MSYHLGRRGHGTGSSDCDSDENSSEEGSDGNEDASLYREGGVRSPPRGSKPKGHTRSEEARGGEAFGSVLPKKKKGKVTCQGRCDVKRIVLCGSAGSSDPNVP